MTLSALEIGIDAMQDWLGLHRGIELHYIVDRYEIEFTDRDGEKTVQTIPGPTLSDAVRLAALAAPRA